MLPVFVLVWLSSFSVFVPHVASFCASLVVFVLCFCTPCCQFLCLFGCLRSLFLYPMLPVFVLVWLSSFSVFVPHVASFCACLVVFVLCLCTPCCQFLCLFGCLRSLFLYPMFPVFLDCPLVIVPSVFSNVYLFNYFIHYMSVLLRFTTYNYSFQGRIQDFKLGGGRTLKNCAERREARKCLGYFV